MVKNGLEIFILKFIAFLGECNYKIIILGSSSMVYSSVPNRDVGTFINFDVKFQGFPTA
jgi:hypothetical protein